jgi:hypothetical protein
MGECGRFFLLFDRGGYGLRRKQPINEASSPRHGMNSQVEADLSELVFIGLRL